MSTSHRTSGRQSTTTAAMLQSIARIEPSTVPGRSTTSLGPYNVERGKYAVDRMLKRVDHCELPRIHLVDMRREG